MVLCITISGINVFESDRILYSPGTHLTYFRSLCEPQFVVKDQDGNVALRIEGPLCTYSICGDVEFKVMSPDGSTEVGKISKQWSGLAREAFTDADNFGISFPMDLDVRMKAVLMGAVFLIDFMFFEKKANEESSKNRNRRFIYCCLFVPVIVIFIVIYVNI